MPGKRITHDGHPVPVVIAKWNDETGELTIAFPGRKKLTVTAMFLSGKSQAITVRRAR